MLGLHRTFDCEPISVTPEGVPGRIVFVGAWFSVRSDSCGSHVMRFAGMFRWGTR